MFPADKLMLQLRTRIEVTKRQRAWYRSGKDMFHYVQLSCHAVSCRRIIPNRLLKKKYCPPVCVVYYFPFFQEKNSSIVEKRQHGYQKTTILSRKKVQK